MARIKVIYLSRAINDPRFSWAFFESMARHNAGTEFDLIVAAKGYEDGYADPALLAFRDKVGCSQIDVLNYEDSVLPLPLFLDVAGGSDGELVIFFTSWSRVLAPNWLRYYADAFEKVPACGVVGATGGYERLTEDTQFPNIGIRTNAFMVSRQLFLSLDGGDLDSPWGGNLFEAGPNSMTKQIMERGLAPIVVDRFGRYWPKEEWASSKTFRSSQQEGLLIADNRTHNYHVANIRKRRRLALRCWGSSKGIARRPLLSKVADWYEWNYPRGVSDLSHDLLDTVARASRALTGRAADKPARIFPA